MQEYDLGGADYRAQSHVHRRRLGQRTGIPYPANYADNAYRPVEPVRDDSSVLANPVIPINGETLTMRQRRAFRAPTIGASTSDVERRMYGIYKRE